MLCDHSELLAIVTYLPREHTTKKTNVHKKYQIYAVYVGQVIPIVRM